MQGLESPHRATGKADQTGNQRERRIHRLQDQVEKNCDYDVEGRADEIAGITQRPGRNEGCEHTDNDGKQIKDACEPGLESGHLRRLSVAWPSNLNT